MTKWATVAFWRKGDVFDGCGSIGVGGGALRGTHAAQAAITEAIDFLSQTLTRT